MPTVSVVIPTLNAAQQLPVILNAIREQTLQPLEVVVVDSASADETPSVARALGARLLSVRRTEFDHGGTRNIGLHAVSSDIVAFTVQDAVPANVEWLANLCEPIIRDHRVGVVTGRQIPRPDATRLEQITRLFSYPLEGFRREREDLTRFGLRAAFCTDTNAAYRVSMLKGLGGFPEPCIVNEDMAAAAALLDAGFSLMYEPRAAIIHSHHYGLREQFQRYFDIGVFFADNRRLRAMGRAPMNALWYVRKHLAEVFREGGVGLLIPWILDAVARGAGVVTGRNYRWVPSSLRRHFSRQKSYWAVSGAASTRS